MSQQPSFTDDQGLLRRSPYASGRLVSFDGGVVAEACVQRPDRYDFWRPAAEDQPVIPRGAGLSYAAASFSQGGLSIEHRSFDRILDFDGEQRVVEVEAGIELGALHDFLSSRGLYLPVQPGHGRITVGGCIGADVHGKNHARDGTFIGQVVGLTLFHPDHGLIEVSPTVEPQLFRLTCGGYGLTGNIVRARLRAQPIPSYTLEAKAGPVRDMQSGLRNLEQEALAADLAYTWHDCMRRGAHFGAGYVFTASFLPQDPDAPADHAGRKARTPALSAAQRGGWAPGLLNGWTTRGLNLAYRLRQSVQGRVHRIGVREALFPIHETQFYFKLFGRAGFHEYQVLIPHERVADYIEAVKDYLAHTPLAITLASAKLFRGRQELLRFTGDGICLALNFPRGGRSPGFLEFLDELVISCGGIPNIIKDSRLPRSVVEACYPEVALFREQLRLFDPKRRYRSELSERLGL